LTVLTSSDPLILLLAATNSCFAQASLSPDPPSSVYFKDVDGDGKPDKFTYQIKRWENDYEGALRIVSAKGSVLWEHEYPIGKGDLNELLSTEGDATGRKVILTDWVKKFFIGELNYGAAIERIKIKAEDIDNEQIDYAAKLASVSPRKLKREIISQRSNTVVFYRAEWREDLMMIVYVPSLRKFVCYSRGY